MILIPILRPLWERLGETLDDEHQQGDDYNHQCQIYPLNHSLWFFWADVTVGEAIVVCVLRSLRGLSQDSCLPWVRWSFISPL